MFRWLTDYSLRSTAKKPKGFTLVELLVAISIIAVLSASGIAVYSNARQSALDGKKRADIDAIRKAFEKNFSPDLNGGQGGYKALQGTDFASGSVPSNPDGGSYAFFTPSPKADGSIGWYNVCATLSDSSPYCKTSIQGEPQPPTVTLAASTTTTSGLTVPSGNARVLVVVVDTYSQGGTCAEITGIAWKVGTSTQNLTSAGCQNLSNWGDLWIWYLVAPNIGSGTIQFTTNNTPLSFIASSWTGVDQTNPLRTSGAVKAASTANATSFTLSNISTAPYDAVVDGVIGLGGLTGPNAGQTLILNANGTQLGSSYYRNISSSTTASMRWNQSTSSSWAMVAISLRRSPI